MNPLSNIQRRLFERRRLQVILQNEHSECALACIAMIATYFGQDMDIADARALFGIQSRGTSLADLISFANALKFTARAVKVELDELPQLQTPCILHWNFNHFVVLKCVGRKITIIDPACGEAQLSVAQASESFTGIALELHPNVDFSKKASTKKLRLRHFFSSIQGIKRQLGTVFLFSLGIQVFALLTPFYMQTVIDQIVVQRATDTLQLLALGFVLVLLLESLFLFIRERLMLRITNSFGLILSASVFHHLLNLPGRFFMSRHTGDILSRFSSVHHIRDFIVAGLVSGMIDGLLALLTLIVLFSYSSTLALLVIGVCLAYTLLRWALIHPLRLFQNQQLIADAQQNSFFMQSIRAICSLKLADALMSTHTQWLNKLSEAMNHQLRISRWQLNFSIVNKLLFGLEHILIIYLAALMVIQQQFSVGMMIAFISYKQRFVSSFEQLIQQWINFLMLKVHIGRLADIVHTTPENYSAQESMQPMLQVLPLQSKSRVFLCVEGLSYAHEGSKDNVFENVSLTAEPNQMIAIAGSSGCGKTTLLHCLCGLLNADKGQITIAGVKLTTQTRNRLQIATVLQHDQLLSGSILQNISGFASVPDINKVYHCARLACIEQDILSMPMQFNTLIGDMGNSLSGGQQQRLLIARALYSGPKLLLLDEATSHLDLATERQLLGNLSDLQICIVMIAHRVQTIAYADHVFRLLNTGLVEDNKSNYQVASNIP